MGREVFLFLWRYKSLITSSHITEGNPRRRNKMRYAILLPLFALMTLTGCMGCGEEPPMPDGGYLTILVTGKPYPNDYRVTEVGGGIMKVLPDPRKVILEKNNKGDGSRRVSGLGNNLRRHLVGEVSNLPYGDDIPEGGVTIRRTVHWCEPVRPQENQSPGTITLSQADSEWGE